MSIRKSLRLNSLVFAVALVALAAPARAENVTKECAARYQAAKAANQLGGDTYLQFYSKCAAQIKAQNAPSPAPAAEPAPAPAAAAPPPPPPPVAAPVAPKPAAAPKPGAAPAASGPVVFPTAVNPAYANEKPGKAILKTCVDQYNANKATGANGDLKWIQKGGGYYSQCNKRLKGA